MSNNISSAPDQRDSGTATTAGALLPCPFCGGQADHHHIGNAATTSRGTKIWCTQCRFSKTVKAIRNDLAWTRATAITAWNIRTPCAATLAHADLLDAARKALNFISNTESELGISLASADALRAAISKAENLND